MNSAQTTHKHAVKAHWHASQLPPAELSKLAQDIQKMVRASERAEFERKARQAIDRQGALPYIVTPAMKAAAEKEAGCVLPQLLAQGRLP